MPEKNFFNKLTDSLKSSPKLEEEEKMPEFQMQQERRTRYQKQTRPPSPALPEKGPPRQRSKAFVRFCG
jgi:hypothetical protein